jgi:acyl-CoA reductase-like NAD-dependent aldehyde dehydrogenase
MIQVVRAYDRSPLAKLPADDADALEAKLSAARGVFLDRDGWLEPHQRIDILRKLVALLEGKIEHFAQLIAAEGGKPYTDARVEATRALDGVRNATDELRNFGGKEIPMGLTAASAGRLAFTVREPIGVVAAISAFNHPLNLIVHQVVPAIATGCPVIVKPASATPLCCLGFVDLVREAGLPEPWCQTFLPDSNALSEALTTDPRIAFLSFIGSAKVGWYLHGKLAHGTRSALEHGGVAPVIVDASADLDRVVPALVKGGYYHAGQVCVSTQRVFVHDKIKDGFLALYARAVQALKFGDPLLPETEVGPLILPKEADRVMSWIEEAKAAGATVVTGATRLTETTVMPTVIVEPPAQARLSKEEVFGPVTCVYGFTNLDRAIETASSLPASFQSSIFTADLAAAFRAAQRLDASAVMVNDHTAFRTDWMPFAGRRQSGYGIGGIPWTMHEMTQHKMIMIRTE